MNTAEVFSNGGSQAVRLPKDYRLEDKEILVHEIESVVTLFPKKDRWQEMLASFDSFTDDFLAEPISSLPPEDREPIE